MINLLISLLSLLSTFQNSVTLLQRHIIKWSPSQYFLSFYVLSFLIWLHPIFRLFFLFVYSYLLCLFLPAAYLFDRSLLMPTLCLFNVYTVYVAVGKQENYVDVFFFSSKLTIVLSDSVSLAFLSSSQTSMSQLILSLQNSSTFHPLLSNDVFSFIEKKTPKPKPVRPPTPWRPTSSHCSSLLSRSKHLCSALPPVSMALSYCFHLCSNCFSLSSLRTSSNYPLLSLIFLSLLSHAWQHRA